MREIMLETVAVTLYTIQGFVLAWYCSRFARPKFERFFGGKYYIVPFWVLIRELLGNLWNTDYQPTLTIVKQIFVLAALYLCILWFYDTYVQMRLYLCGTYTAIGEVCLFLILELSQFHGHVFQIGVWMFEHGKWSYGFTMGFMDVVSFLLQMLTNILYLLFFWKLIHIVTEKFRYKGAKLENKELAYLLSSALVGLILGLLFRSMLYTLEDGVPFLLYDKYPILHVFVPLILITILGGIVSTILFYQDLAEKNEKQLSMWVLEQQLEGMKSQMEEIERVSEANRNMRHDIKNILSVAMNLSEDPGKKNELRQYLADAESSMQQSDLKFQTGDSAADSMLNMKYHEVIRRVPHIVYDADAFLLPKGMRIHSFDLCVILGNALDNA